MNYFLSLGLLIIFGFGFCILDKKQSLDVAVVDMEEMFRSFEMTKEVNGKYTQLVKQHDLKLDSLNKVMTSVHKDPSTNDRVQASNLLALKIKKIQESKDQVKYELEQQIWNQLNQYLGEFGALEKYDLIHGSMNGGELIYVNSTLDVTDEVLMFINNKYNGIP